MLASILITALSLVLLLYWFRYTCLLLLRDRASVLHHAPDSRLGFHDVRERVQTEADLDPLHRALDRDYRLLTYLLQHAARLGTQSLEDRFLLLDYRIMQWWYALTRSAAPAQARRALAEMADVLACLAHKMSEQAGLLPEA